MGDPHNPARYGEAWDPIRLQVMLEALQELRDKCPDEDWLTPSFVISGGWAWHFMSPPGHTELKHAHDHRDLDLFADPEEVAALINILVGLGYRKVKTRFAPGQDDFRRYERVDEPPDGKPVKILIDLFLRDVPSIMANGWSVVEPKYLLGLYSDHHSSGQCFAVQAASKLLEKGINPVGRPELVTIPENEGR
jgi:hypothetical protein